MKNHEIPKGDKDFTVFDKQAFDDYKNWVALETCPKFGAWFGPSHQYKNPNDNRRIEVQNTFDAFKTPLNNGNVNTDFVYWIFTTSKKASWNKYKTNHYLSIDIRTQLYQNGFASGGVTVRQNTDTGDTNTKYGDIYNYIGGFRDVSDNFTTLNFHSLTETIAGSSGMTGTAGSHRGMNDLWGRQQCD